ncbi:polysaccharide deacetylase family protein [Marinobacter salicampi]|uniref:polysaccharide deacetylase family protein n=1 Tax=Marinobacter salicampi TaxID=435907 RepID=UPI00140D2898|nr:polysaccharide deacetylase family protein [Marinobacter salicampi]
MSFSETAINFLTSSPVCRVMQPLRRRVVPVFLLHRFADNALNIHGHCPDHLEAVLIYLRANGYTVISVRELVHAMLDHRPLPERAVAFTLDDGFYDQADSALPLFEKHKAPVTLFLATDMQEQQYWSWDYKLEYLFKHTTLTSMELDLGLGPVHVQFSNPEERRTLVRQLRQVYKCESNRNAEQVVKELGQMLEVEVPVTAPPEYQSITWDQVRRIESPYIEFGPHTKRHPILAQVSDDEARSEILGSWEILKRNVANPVPVFCYPSGRESIDFGDREKRIVAEAGLLGALSADPGYAYLLPRTKNDIYAIKRFSFPNTMPPFKQYCSWLEYAKEILTRA